MYRFHNLKFFLLCLCTRFRVENLLWSLTPLVVSDGELAVNVELILYPSLNIRIQMSKNWNFYEQRSSKNRFCSFIVSSERYWRFLKIHHTFILSFSEHDKIFKYFDFIWYIFDILLVLILFYFFVKKLENLVQGFS